MVARRDFVSHQLVKVCSSHGEFDSRLQLNKDHQSDLEQMWKVICFYSFWFSNFSWICQILHKPTIPINGYLPNLRRSICFFEKLVEISTIKDVHVPQYMGGMLPVPRSEQINGWPYPINFNKNTVSIHGYNQTVAIANAREKAYILLMWQWRLHSSF